MNWQPKQKVVVPIDFSEKSFTALDSALELVDDASHIYMVNVLQELSVVEPGEVWDMVTDESRSEHVQNAFAKKLSDAKYNGIHTEVLFGDPGSEITDYAKKIDAELIVLSSDGRTGITRLLIGSVAERVVRIAHCPVLVLRD